MTGTGEGNKASYIEHIGLFFFFVACSGVSIIVWVFNWICWHNQCCCCDFLHNPINKRIVWWTCFIFFLGLLACCISGFVTTNRFGFALEGSYCSFERFYYDSIYGQLKENYPKWEGLENLSKKLEKLDEFINNEIAKYESLRKNLEKNINFYEGYYDTNFLDLYNKNCSNSSEEICKLAINKTLPFSIRYGRILDSYNKTIYFMNNFDTSGTYLSGIITYINNMKNDFTNLKDRFLSKFHYYARIANGWGRVLTMIYFCLLLIAVTFAGFSMMFYVCLRNQGYLAIFMHVLWNIIRFFIFSFFFYGAAYGMCYLALRDAVAYVMFVFGENNILLNDRSYLIPTDQGRKFLQTCLINENNNFKYLIDDILTSSLEDIFKNANELKDLIENKENFYLKSTEGYSALVTSQGKFINKIIDNTKTITDNDIFRQFSESSKLGGLFSSFDCSFLKSDLAMMYRTLYDLSVEARILCALSCCIGFFGAIAVYFFLLVMHHYNMDLFYDSGQSIFIGIDGNSKRKKISNKDPGYKKRKIRSEIELSSRNEEYSGANRNED